MSHKGAKYVKIVNLSYSPTYQTNMSRIPLPPPPPPPLRKSKLLIRNDESLLGGWGLFEVRDLEAFKMLGFVEENMEVRGQTDRGTSMVIVEELPDITLNDINQAITNGIIVAKLVEL